MDALILARVSTESQSLESQIDKLIEESKKMGYDNYTIISGKESGVKLDIEERLTIQKMKQYIETGRYDMLLIWEVSRLARRPKVLYEVREYLIEHHVNLHCMTPQFTMLKEDGTIDPTASIVFAIFGTMAEEEARLSKERMRRGRIARREQLKYIGGNVLFGYTWDNETKKIQIDRSKIDTVIEFFERYSNNESIRSIAKDMLDRGLLPYEDYSTACVMMRRMIRRSEYAGIKDKTYDYPPIISQDLFSRVRNRAESKNHYKTRLSAIYYLQGILRWKYNGMLLSPAKHAVMYRAWDEKSEKGIMINMDYIDSIVWHFVTEYKKRISGPEKERALRSILDGMSRVLQKQRKAIDDHIKIEQTIERINERVVRGKMSDEQGDRLIREENNKLKELDQLMARWHIENEQYKRQLEVGVDTDLDNLNDEQKQRIIRESIKYITVDKDGTSSGRIIEIMMMDDRKTVIHMTKRGNYFNTYLISGNREIRIEIELFKRFVRKRY